MIITSKNGSYFKDGKTTDIKGTVLTLGEEKQQIRGFGTCFSELGARALNRLTKEDKKAVLDELFTDSGANFNYCRTPIGASDFSLDFYSYSEVADDYEMKHFSIDRDKKLLLPLILEAVKRQDQLQMFASPWCPPLWLKTVPVYSNGVFDRTEKKLKAYALYFKKYVQAYHEAGVPIIHIHPQNEPCSNQVFPSCVWHGDELTEFIGGYLGPALENENVDIFYGTINGPEGDWRFPWTRYNNYLGYAMQDEKARKYIKGVGYQWAGKFALPQTRDDYPDLEVIQTESECGDGLNTWERTMHVYALMRYYFRFGASAYVYWNIALDADGLSTWGWRQNSLVTVDKNKAVFNPEYYLMKHFARFVRRGAKYVKVNGEFASNCTTFKNPDGSYVMVAYNPYPFDKTITINDKSYILPSDSINTIIF